METLIKLNSGKGVDLSIICTALQTITMPIEAYTELVEYTKHYDTEVSGVGLVEKIESKVELDGEYKYSPKKTVHTVTYRITDVFLPPMQDNTGASTEIKEVAISELVTRLIREGKDPSKLKMHWHSHVNMGTFHSGTDEENYQGLDNKEYLVSLVVNKRREILGRVDIYSPVYVSFINVPVFMGVSVETVVNEKIKVNIEGLDKYMKEEKTKLVTNAGFGNAWREDGYSNWDEKKIKEWQREHRIKAKLRTQMKMKPEEAWVYEECTATKMVCSACKESKLCYEYKEELAKRMKGD